VLGAPCTPALRMAGTCGAIVGARRANEDSYVAVDFAAKLPPIHKAANPAQGVHHRQISNNSGSRSPPRHPESGTIRRSPDRKTSHGSQASRLPHTDDLKRVTSPSESEYSNHSPKLFDQEEESVRSEMFGARDTIITAEPNFGGSKRQPAVGQSDDVQGDLSQFRAISHEDTDEDEQALEEERHTSKMQSENRRQQPDKTWAQNLLAATWFDASIGAVIVGNSVTIGMEQSMTLEGMDTSWFDWLEHVFLIVYLGELGVRAAAYGVTMLTDRWVQFDILLVSMGVTTEWLLRIPFCGGNQCNVDGLGFIMVLRTARLFRLARTVRLLIQFKELWMLVRGLMDSASTMCYTLLMMFIIIYIFSSVGLELITKHRFTDGLHPEYDAEFAEHVDLLFGTLPKTMLSLVQFSTLDSVHAIYLPIVRKDPILMTFFLGVILVVSVVLMNLITAVVVNSAMEQAMQDKELMRINEEKHRKKLVKDLRVIFERLDEDGSGEVSEDEIANIDDVDRMKLEQVLGIADPIEIFRTLDVDKSGSIGIDEFCDGIWQVAAQKGNIELKRIEKKLDSLRLRVESHEYFHQQVKDHLGLIKEACLSFAPPVQMQALSSPSGSTPHRSKAWDSKDNEEEKELLKLMVREIQLLKAAVNGGGAVVNTEAPGFTMPLWAMELKTQMREVKGGMIALAKGGMKESTSGSDSTVATELDLKQENDSLRFQLAVADNALLKVLQANEGVMKEQGFQRCITPVTPVDVSHRLSPTPTHSRVGTRRARICDKDVKEVHKFIELPMQSEMRLRQYPAAESWSHNCGRQLSRSPSISSSKERKGSKETTQSRARDSDEPGHDREPAAPGYTSEIGSIQDQLRVPSRREDTLLKPEAHMPSSRKHGLTSSLNSP